MATSKFKADILKFAEKVDVSIGTVLKRVALDVHNRVVKRTPVDTGRARAAWNIAQGEPDLSVPPEDFAGGEKAAQKAAQEKQEGLGHVTADSIVVISNNLPYIERLENGHSQQAPAGMVKVALAEVEAGITSGLE